MLILLRAEPLVGQLDLVNQLVAIDELLLMLVRLQVSLVSALIMKDIWLHEIQIFLFIARVPISMLVRHLVILAARCFLAVYKR